MRTHWLVCLVAVLGCKKEPASPGVEAPAAPASTAEQDALWQLAPDGAQIGVVGSTRRPASSSSRSRGLRPAPTDR